MKPACATLLLAALASGGCSEAAAGGGQDARDRAAPADPGANLHAQCREREARVREELGARIRELEAELRREQGARLDREREWLRFTQGIAQLESLAGAPRFEADAPPEPAPASAPPATELPPAPDAAEVTAEDPAGARLAELERAQRSRAVFLALRSLFAMERISGLDLLESGVVQDGFVGPVVLRVLDDRGRPLGSLYADRLRLEGSRAARTLTLLLENGWERRGGERQAFAGGPADAEGRGGVRRIDLAYVDPTPWFEALPELFRADQREAVLVGDPRRLTAARFELNRLLRADAAGSIHRLESLSDLTGNLFREVHLAVLDADGKLEKELFADRMSVLSAERGLEILLEGGSQMRGSEKAPFLGGRYRIFLPRASAETWRAAGIPVVDRPGAPIPGGGG